MRKAIRVSVKVPVEVRQENGRFIATCFLLSSSHDAPSKHGALENLAGAVQALMFSRFKDRDIDRLLQDHDLRAHLASNGIAGGSYIDVSVTLKAPEPELTR